MLYIVKREGLYVIESLKRKKGAAKLNIIQRFIDGILILTNEKVMMNDIGYETLLMEIDEIDDNIIPQNVTATLGNPIVTWSVNYTNTIGDYYLYIAIDRKEINLESFEVWFRNGEIIPNPFDQQNPN